MDYSYNSPSRPMPHFFNDNHSFTTKKARSTSTPSCKKVPPRPPSKSVPPVSRLFAQPSYNRAQAISFNDNSDPSLSLCYDETREESYFEQCFQIERKLGSGSFGDVYKVRSKEDGIYYAIKKWRERFKGSSDRERKLQEVSKHELLPQHPNCVKFICAWEEKQYLFIQTELCEISLSDFADANHDIPETLVWSYFVDLLKAVKHLHDHDLIHLDIKPDNIFITYDGVCKLGDFGLVLDLKKNDTNEATEGDPKYLAKELMQAIFTKSADIFSLGITILELACDLDLPSGGEGWHQLRDDRIPDDLFIHLSPELKFIIKTMMHPDYRRRPSASELLQHPAICKFENRRMWKLKVKRSFSAIKNVFRVFFMFLINIIFTVKYPFQWLSKRMRKDRTPPHSFNTYKNHISDWDGSYSDDEVFDQSAYSQSISAFSDTSSSSCEAKLSSNDAIFPNSNSTNFPRQFCSTTVIQRHRPIFDPLQSPSFKTSSPIAKINNSGLHESPTLFKEPFTRHKLVNQKLNFCDNNLDENQDDDDNDDDLNEWDKSFNIGPKNLLSTFEEIEKEKDDAT